MIKRPNAGWHMVNWGFLSGSVLAVLLMIFLTTFGQFGTSSLEVVGLLVNPFIWIVGVMFGGIPGAILGAVESIFVGGRLKNAPEPFTVDDMQRYRWGIYARAAAIPFVLHLVLTILVGATDPIEPLVASFAYFIILGIPVAIAMLASMYAAHRYMFRLRLYGMQHSDYFRKPKQKYKTMHEDALNRLQDVAESIENGEFEGQLWQNDKRRK